MNPFWATFAAVFSTVFFAEVGDKTQLATLLFSARAEAPRWAVFLGSSSALVVASAIGVLVGTELERLVSQRTLQIIAGLGFLAIGVWTLYRALLTSLPSS